MVWRRYPFESIWSEMEHMRAELDEMFQLASSGGRFLPAARGSDRLLPALRGEFRVDVREHGDEVIVVADLPGVECPIAPERPAAAFPGSEVPGRPG